MELCNAVLVTAQCTARMLRAAAFITSTTSITAASAEPASPPRSSASTTGETPKGIPDRRATGLFPTTRTMADNRNTPKIKPDPWPTHWLGTSNTGAVNADAIISSPRVLCFTSTSMPPFPASGSTETPNDADRRATGLAPMTPTIPNNYDTSPALPLSSASGTSDEPPNADRRATGLSSTTPTTTNDHETPTKKLTTDTITEYSAVSLVSFEATQCDKTNLSSVPKRPPRGEKGHVEGAYKRYMYIPLRFTVRE